MNLKRPAAALLVLVVIARAQTTDGGPQLVPLTAPAGVPLRLYLTHSVPKRVGAPVKAKLLAPVYVFDRMVLPTGTEAFGSVLSCPPVSKWQRMRAVLNGDFTPLHGALIQFTSLRLPDGSTKPLQTVASAGLDSVYPVNPPKPSTVPPGGTGGLLGTGKQKIKDQMSAGMDHLKSIPQLVRAPDKKEQFSDFLLSKLPYHPQSVRNRTRFDAELAAPLTFGSETVTPDALRLFGSRPTAGTVAHASLLTPLDSATAVSGQKVDATLTEPLRSADGRLIFPEGTHVTGSVVQVRKAGWFHHTGRLRFTFQQLEVPQLARGAVPPSSPAATEKRDHVLQFRTQGTLLAAESSNAPVKVDGEGGVQATDSKTRFIGTAIAVLIAHAAGDNDAIRSPGGVITGQSQNVAGRTLGGGSGFGLLGTIASQASRNVGAGFGYYGLAWSVYSTVIARGAEVQFRKNSVIDITFNERANAPVASLKPVATTPKSK